MPAAKSFFSFRSFRKSGRKRRLCRRTRSAHLEALEPRQLLAGDVTAAVVGGDLRLTGDELDNTVTVSIVDGDVVVQGLDDTTVNGVDTPFVAFAGTSTITDDLFTRLGRGADVLSLAGGLEVAGRVAIRGGTGSTRIGLDDVTVGGAIDILGTRGGDVVNFNNVDVTGKVRMRLGSGDNVVNVRDTVSHDLGVRTGGGDDVIVLDTFTGNDDVGIRTGRGEDDVVIQDSSIEDKVKIRTQGGDDFVMVDPTTVGSRFLASLGGGDDSFVDESNEYGSVTVRAGSGTDAVQFDPATVVSGRRSLRQTESETVDETVMEMRLNDPDTGALTEAKTAEDFFNDLNGNIDDNTPPTTSGIPDVTVEQDAPDSIVNLFDAFDDAEDTDADLAYVIDTNTNAALFTSTPIDAGMLTLDFAPGMSGSADLTVRATDTGRLFETTQFTVTVNPPGVLSLTVDVSANETISSIGTLLTNEPVFNVAGSTGAGATVAVDRDGDGAFDDGTTTADALGNYALDVTLVHNDDNNGVNELSIRATRDSDEVIEGVIVHLAVGTVVRFDSTLGTWDVELEDADAPNTVAAFLQDLSRYDATVVHRNVDGFVVQGGSFRFDAAVPTIVDAPDFPEVPNEFAAADPPNSNERESLSTAQTASPDSFSGGWFYNTVDNNASGGVNLDSVPHTPYGRVIGAGMTVVDAIHATATFGIGDTLPNSDAFAQTPLVSYTPVFEPIGGTVTVSGGSRIVSGTATSFITDLARGQGLRIGGEQKAVSRIVSETLLELVQPQDVGVTGVVAEKNTAAPGADNFVTINSVTKILDPPGTMANTFTVFENTAAGTVIGKVVADNGASGPMVYQIDDPSMPEELKLGVVDHMSGDPTARAVMIEYLDLECPGCKALHPTIAQLEDDFEGDLLVVQRHLPLTSIHARAFDAAIATEAADRQGMFDEMVDKLFETQGAPGEWTDPSANFQDRVEAYATELGLSLAQFRADQVDPDLEDRVNRDLASAASLGANSTPTVYLNGTSISLPTTLDLGDYTDLIQDELDAFDEALIVNRDNGELIVADAGLLDFETTPTFTLDICAANGTTERITSTINVIDVTE